MRDKICSHGNLPIYLWSAVTSSTSYQDVSLDCTIADDSVTEFYFFIPVGDEVVLFEWTEMARWHTVTGDRLPPRDVVTMGGMSKKYMVVLNKTITQGK